MGQVISLTAIDDNPNLLLIFKHMRNGKGAGQMHSHSWAGEGRGGQGTYLTKAVQRNDLCTQKLKLYKLGRQQVMKTL